MSKIDHEETKNSLFGSLKKTNSDHVVADPVSVPSVKKVPPVETVPQGEEKSAIAPKWATLDKVTVLLAPDQKEGLDRIAKKLMKHRSQDLKGKNDKERITANTLIRALVHQFLKNEHNYELETISSEEDAYRWVEKYL